MKHYVEVLLRDKKRQHNNIQKEIKDFQEKVETQYSAWTLLENSGKLISEYKANLAKVEVLDSVIKDLELIIAAADRPPTQS